MRPEKTSNHIEVGQPKKGPSFLKKHWDKILSITAIIAVLTIKGETIKRVESVLDGYGHCQDTEKANEDLKTEKAREKEAMSCEVSRLQQEKDSLIHQRNVLMGQLSVLRGESANVDLEAALREMPFDDLENRIKMLEDKAGNTEATKKIEKERKTCIAAPVAARLQAMVILTTFTVPKVLERCGGIDLATIDCMLNLEYPTKANPDSMVTVKDCDREAIAKLTAETKKVAKM